LSELCLRCGLCCDGSLFDHVALTEAEAQALIERDVAVGLKGDSRYVIEQRCSALEGTCCKAYEARPHGCRVYECLLATSLKTNEVSFDEAAQIVDEALDRIRALDAVLPNGEGAPTSPVRRVLWADAPGNGGPLKAEAHDAWERVREFLRRHFTGRYGFR
jgi:uncharacterized protein